MSSRSAARWRVAASSTDRRSRIAAVVALLASSGLVVTSLLPWVRTGARDRSSYELLAAARRLEVLSSGFEHGLLVAWRFLPLVVALGWLAFVTRGARLAAITALAAGVGALATAMAVERTPLHVLPATSVTMGLAGVGVGSALLSLILQRSHVD